MSKFDINELVELAQSALKDLNEGQDFLLSEVYAATKNAYSMHREDPVIRGFAHVIERKIEKHGGSHIINQAQMTDAFNTLARLGDTERFRSVLGGFIKSAEPIADHTNENFVQLNRLDANNSQLTNEDFITDQGLANDLGQMLGDEVRAYNAKVASQGKDMVELELSALGFKPRVSVLGGDDSVIVYGANFETRAGLVRVAIPLDISGEKLLFPSVFVADDHLEQLRTDTLKYFVDKKALAITSPEVFDTNQNAEPKPDLDINPKVEMPKELAHLAPDFEQDILESASSFGKDAVNSGKNMIIAELASAGFKGAQVRFASENNNAVVYSAIIRTPTGPAEIEVPVEMHVEANNTYRPLSPACFAYDGVIEDFVPSKLQRFAISRPIPSTGEVVYSAAHEYMNLPELKDEIMKAVAENDYMACEMILGTIMDKFDEEQYKNAVADYHYMLKLKSQHNSDEAPKHKCNKIIEAGHGSIEARCGHLLVPLSKVVTAEDGTCKLKSAVERERLNPVEESGASISSHKVFWT